MKNQLVLKDSGSQRLVTMTAQAVERYRQGLLNEVIALGPSMVDEAAAKGHSEIILMELEQTDKNREDLIYVARFLCREAAFDGMWFSVHLKPYLTKSCGYRYTYILVGDWSRKPTWWEPRFIASMNSQRDFRVIVKTLLISAAIPLMIVAAILYWMRTYYPCVF